MINTFAFSKQARIDYIKCCELCSAELDIEDFYFNNSCQYCGSSENYDLEVYNYAK